MENATKALVIAGAILVSILLVTMGIALLGNSDSLNKSSQNQMSQLEVQQFNGRLEVGVGTNVSGANVKTMLNAAAAMYRDDDTLDLEITGVGITITDKDKIKEALKKGDDIGIKSTRRYTVESSKDESSGLINNIKITAK